MESVKILLVEDESIEAMDIKRTLESFDYMVPYVASNGSEAVRKAAEIMPDLILMDIIIKGKMDGIHVAKEIKSLGIPVIYLTAHSQDATVKRALSTEPYGYLIKPYDKKELKYSIDIAIYKHKLETQLKDSEKKYRALVEQAADALFVHDFNGNFVDVNKQACKSLGYSREELLNMNVMDIEMDFNLPHAQKQWKKIKKNQPFNLYGHQKRKDGTVFPVEIHFAVVNIREQKLIMGLVRDITDRILSEKKITEKEEKYRTLFDTMVQGVTYQDAKGNITSINPAALKMMGIKDFDENGKITDHILGSIHEDGSQFPGEDHPSMVALKTGKEVKNVVMGVKYPTRKGYTWLKIHAVPQFKSGETKPYQVFTTFEDITHRKNAEKALKDSENKYRTLFDNAPDGIILMEGDTFIEANQKALEIYHVTRENFIGKSFYSILSPEKQPDGESSKDKILRLISNALKGEPQHFKWKHLNFQSKPFFTEITLNRIKIEDKYLIQAIVRDITEKEEANNSLMESQQRLTDIFDFLPDATFAIDLNGKVIAWNKAIEEMTGTTKADMIDQGNHAYSIPFYGYRRPILIDLIKSGNQKFREKYEYINKKGKTLFAEVFVPSVYEGRGAYLWVTASPLLNSEGQQYGAIESIRDVTERKNAEKAVIRNAERFRAVAESAIDAIVTTDADGKIIYYNNSLNEIFGYQNDELTGKPLTILMPDRFKDNYLKELIEFKKSGKHRLMGKIVTTIGLKKDKTEFPFEMSLSAWKTEDVTYFTSIIRDLTERMKAEEQIKNSLKEKELLMQEIHHRVKNNMQIVSSLLNLQTINLEGEAVDILKESQNRVKAMAMIHEKLYQSPDLSTINLKDYIQSMVTDLFYSYNIGTEQVIFKLDINPDIRLNIETSVPCGLIISELVSNTLKYAFIPDKKGLLTVSLQKNGDDYELIVSDNGIGIPQELDFRNTKSLGLQLVNNLVNQLDGTITLKNGDGAEFRILFKELSYKERI